MIAADTSTLVAFNAGESGNDIDRLTEALQSGTLVLPPVVLSELLSDPDLPANIEKQILRIPLLSLKADFWIRLGAFRRHYLSRGLKCRLADAQIALSCIDANVPLIARDQDFKKYAKDSGLKLYL